MPFEDSSALWSLGHTQFKAMDGAEKRLLSRAGEGLTVSEILPIALADCRRTILRGRANGYHADAIRRVGCADAVRQ
jgi:hypothetical protein